MQNSSNITVDFVDLTDASNRAAELIAAKQFDFLIIVGYLENERNYEMVKLFQNTHKYSVVAFYALCTEHIVALCMKHRIEYLYDRTDPFDGLLIYMAVAYETQQDIKSFDIKAAQEKREQQEQTKQLEKPAGFLAALWRLFK